MEKLFIQIANMSITASYVILFVILIRLFLKRIPKIYSYSLWMIVLVRLLVPFSFSSVFSMMPVSTRAISADIIDTPKAEIHSRITTIDRVINNVLPEPVVGTSVNPVEMWILLGQFIWLAGMLMVLIYSVLTSLKLARKLKLSRYFRDNIYEVNHIGTPFVFGVLKPKIYIPFGLSEIEQSYIIRHEEIHIKRFDHIIKFISFIATSIHWFNPLVWVAFFLMSKDMELSCDERVISEMGNEIKKDYSHSLLSLSSSRRIIGGSPLAFGGENTKQRIKNILNYRKPKSWATIMGIIIIVGAVIGLLSNPKEKIIENPESSAILATEEALIKGFLEKYYAQLSYTQREKDEVEQEMDEHRTILSLDGESDQAPSEEVRPNGFYYFFKEVSSPQLYDTMIRNRIIPNWGMAKMGFEKSEISELKLKKDNDIIHTSFKVECYQGEKVMEEKTFEVDFVLKEIEAKIYIDHINGDLGWK